jgi:hypothetical protein
MAATDAFLIAKANQAAMLCEQVSLHSADQGTDGSSESVQNVSLSGAVPVGIVGDAGQWIKTGP